ncbi:polycomb protein Asx-like isoform X2 [Planococcus citri]|uniref:polycomb protein Asx-like isoform X2 n=1 Tax=Planococcus citri TaxID=170843 RepID=UPI0031F84DDE
MDESGDNKIYLSSSLFGNQKKPQITLSPVRLQKVRGEEGFDGDRNKKSFSGGNTVWSVSKEQTTESIRPVHYSHSHSKKVIKHALRQQAKRRRKNTTIAAGNSASVPRYVATSDNTEEESDNRFKEPTKMIDVLPTIPDFRIKHRKRTNKKLSTAAQLEQTKEGCVDLETPDSILLQTNLRDLLNKHTFSSLPPFYQYKLVQLLPQVDRIPVGTQSECVLRLNPTGLSNEFFNRACTEWKERLAEGEFTLENQQRRKQELEREKNKLDPWKVKHFEPIWGENSNVSCTISVPEKEIVSPKSANKVPVKRPPSPVLRNRTVGAVTRSVSMYREKREAEDPPSEIVKKFKSVTCTETEKAVGENTDEEVDGVTITTISVETTDSTEKPNDHVDVPVENTSSLDNDEATSTQSAIDPEEIIVEHEVNLESPAAECTNDENPPSSELEMKEIPIDEINNDDNLLDHEIGIENIICEEHDNWSNVRDDAAILAAAWDDVECGSDNLLAEVDLERDQEDDIVTREGAEVSPEEENLFAISVHEEKIEVKVEEVRSPSSQWISENPPVESNDEIKPELECVQGVDESTSDNASVLTQVENQVTSTEELTTEVLPSENPPAENIVSAVGHTEEPVASDETEVEQKPADVVSVDVNPPEEEENSLTMTTQPEPTEEILETTQSGVEPAEGFKAEDEEKPRDDQSPNDENELLNDAINIEKIICENEAWDNSKEEQVQAAILAAAWDAVDSDTEKLLAEVAIEGDNEVAVIPMQEELEVRLEESSLPAPEWIDYDSKSEENSQSADDGQKPKSIQYPGGHVKIELEVTLTPEVDNQVTSSMKGSTSTSTNVITSSNTILAPNTIIPPTTIVCLPSSNPTVPTPPTTQLVTTQAVSSSALPYIALTTSTPVRAVPTKTQSGGRGGRGTSNRPPPGAVNLERSYQICQAVIQNSPNRDQLKFQLKPPPSLLKNKDCNKTQNSTRGGHAKPTKTYNASSSKSSMLIKHVFNTPQGIPVTMAVLPTSNTELTESQMGQYVLVQRSGLGSGIRRSNSAPPTNQKTTYGVGGGRIRPASVGLQQQQGTQPPKIRTIVTNQNAQTYYSVPQQYDIRMNDDCSCSFKAMVICKKCGAFCHDDCLGPYKVCVNCR